MLNYILIPKLNIYGASISTVVSALLSAVFTFLISKKYYNIPYDKKIILYASGICILISVNIILPNLSLLVEVIYLVTVFLLIVILLFLSGFIRDLTKIWKKQL